MIKFLIAFGIGVYVILNWPSINSWVNKSDVVNNNQGNSDKNKAQELKNSADQVAPVPASAPVKNENESRASKLF